MKHASFVAPVLVAVFTFGLSMSPALAGGDRGRPNGAQMSSKPKPGITNVPEIDAGSGLTALAALGASLILVRERRRRTATRNAQDS